MTTFTKKRLFVSHASEDNDFAKPLAQALKEDFEVWYDEDQLQVGSSLCEKISQGLAECDYAVVILSPSFFMKNWTNNELGALLAKETASKKVIFPLWHKVGIEEVKVSAPLLADRKSIQSTLALDAIVAAIRFAAGYFEMGKKVIDPAGGFTKLRSGIQRKNEAIRSNNLIMAEHGCTMIDELARRTIGHLADRAKSLEQVSPNGIQCGQHTVLSSSQFLNVTSDDIMLRADYLRPFSNSATGARLRMTISETAPNSAFQVLPVHVLVEENYLPFFSQTDVGFWHTETTGADNISPESVVDQWLDKLADVLNDRNMLG